MLKLFKILDVRIGYAIMAILVPFYMLVNHAAYKAIYHYFRKQLGYGILKAFLWTYKNHYIFGQVILDRFAVFSGKNNFFEAEIIGNEHFIRLTEGKKGFIMASSHTGNFEISGYLLQQHHKKINALVFPDETPTVQRNRARILEQNNIRLIPVSSDMSHIFAINASLSAGEIISMPCDRNWGSAKSIQCRFMNGTAHFPVGAFALAATFDVEILSIFVFKSTARKYKIYVKPIEIPQSASMAGKREMAEEYARAFVREMEENLRKYPAQWFNYYEFFDK